MDIKEILLEEIIPDEDFVYRQVSVRQAPPDANGRRIPNETHFTPDDDGLSVHWNKYIDVKGIYCIIGLSFKPGTGQYKEYSAFKIFQFPVKFLRSVPNIKDVIYTPVINGNPAPVGAPNNNAHASVLYPNDEEIRVKLSDYVRENYADCFCDFDVRSLRVEMEELRQRLNDTQYHKLPTGMNFSEIPN